jgi:hypothetical protein
MADRILFIGWGTPVRGREERSIEVFNEVMGLYGRMQQDGRIESFDVVLLAPSSDLGGYIQLHCSAQQLAAVREDDEFQRSLIAAELCVNDLRIVDGMTDQAIAGQMAMYQEAAARVPQMA